jgi:hypothetical protein
MRLTWTAISIVWLSCVIAGLLQLWHYGHQPGARIEPPYNSVSESGSTHSNHFKLVMFAHPRCPCTRASLHELERIFTQGGKRLDVRILFFKPSNQPRSWVETDLWYSALQIPGASVEVDEDNAIANRLNVATSGCVLMYDGKGKLRFNGGLTSARGHAGDNYGASAVLALVRGEAHDTKTFPVFGCPLRATAQLPRNIGGEGGNVQ